MAQIRSAACFDLLLARDGARHRSAPRWSSLPPPNQSVRQTAAGSRRASASARHAVRWRLAGRRRAAGTAAPEIASAGRAAAVIANAPRAAEAERRSAARPCLAPSAKAAEGSRPASGTGRPIPCRPDASSGSGRSPVQLSIQHQVTPPVDVVARPGPLFAPLQDRIHVLAPCPLAASRWTASPWRVA